MSVVGLSLRPERLKRYKDVAPPAVQVRPRQPASPAPGSTTRWPARCCRRAPGRRRPRNWRRISSGSVPRSSSSDRCCRRAPICCRLPISRRSAACRTASSRFRSPTSSASFRRTSASGCRRGLPRSTRSRSPPRPSDRCTAPRCATDATSPSRCSGRASAKAWCRTSPRWKTSRAFSIGIRARGGSSISWRWSGSSGARSRRSSTTGARRTTSSGSPTTSRPSRASSSRAPWTTTPARASSR